MSKNFLSNKENLAINVPTLTSKLSDQQTQHETKNKENIFKTNVDHSDTENASEFENDDEFLMKRKR